MQETEARTRDAYERALADIRRGEIGGPVSRINFLLPASVRWVRNGPPTSPGVAFPAWTDLSETEIAALMRLHTVLEAESIKDVPDAAGNPNVMAEALPLVDFRKFYKEMDWRPLRVVFLDDPLPKDPREQIHHPVRAAAGLVRYYSKAGAKIRKGKARHAPKVIGGSAEVLTNWLARKPDPDFWQVIVTDISPDSEVAIPLLRWIVAQPDCDRATAATIFCVLDGMRHVGKPLDFQDGGECSDIEIISTICVRSEEDGFTRCQLALPEAGTIPFPFKLLQGPFGGRPPQSGWAVFEESAFIEKI
jgi:hypothetical protein